MLLAFWASWLLLVGRPVLDLFFASRCIAHFVVSILVFFLLVTAIMLAVAQDRCWQLDWGSWHGDTHTITVGIECIVGGARGGSRAPDMNSRRRPVRPANECEQVVAHASTLICFASGCILTSSYRFSLPGLGAVTKWQSPIFLVFFCFF